MTETRELPEAVAGDIKDFRTVICGGVEDLATLAAVEAHVWTIDTFVTLDATVVDTTERTVRIELGDVGGWLPSLPKRGRWWVEVEGEFADGTVLTWPAKGEDTPKTSGSACFMYVREPGR